MSEAAASEPSNRGVDKLSGYLCVRRGFGQHQQKLEGQEVAGTGHDHPSTVTASVMYTCPELAPCYCNRSVCKLPDSLLLPEVLVPELSCCETLPPRQRLRFS